MIGRRGDSLLCCVSIRHSHENRQRGTQEVCLRVWFQITDGHTPHWQGGPWPLTPAGRLFLLPLLWWLKERVFHQGSLRERAHMSSTPPPTIGKHPQLHLLHSGQNWFPLRRFTSSVRCGKDLRRGRSALADLCWWEIHTCACNL